MPSPPPAYAFLRMPTVRTLNPLWDAHEEFDDPRHERELTEGRQTLSTAALAATPEAVTKGEKDTTYPLALAIAITATLAFLIAKQLGFAIAWTLACVAVAAAWLWPEAE
jgi:hypothetical protein